MHGNRIIAQGSPSTDQFVDLWIQHDANIETWAQLVHAAVTAIRGARATRPKMLLLGILPLRYERLLVHHHNQKNGSLADAHQGMILSIPHHGCQTVTALPSLKRWILVVATLSLQVRQLSL